LTLARRHHPAIPGQPGPRSPAHPADRRPLGGHHYGPGKTEGKAEGKVEAILLVLESRGILVTDEQRSQFLSCTDLKQLKSWLERVGTVSSAGELFD
jgi:hypothetical protein